MLQALQATTAAFQAPIPPAPAAMLDTAAAAQFLGLAADTLKKWRLRRKGPPFVQLAPRVVRYAVPDLIAFAEACRRGGTLPPIVRKPGHLG